jgi:hypothetical protein
MITKNHLSYVVSAFLALLAIAGLVTSIYFYRQYRKSEEAIRNPEVAAKEEVSAIISRVGKLMILPVGVPTIMTVSDVNGLVGQPFFVKAQNGDQVLVYTDARKAILYRPKANIIVEVATVVLESSSGSPSAVFASPSGSVAPTQNVVKIAIRNGTNVIGVAGALEKELHEKMTNIFVVEKDNAKARGVEKTFVVDVTGKAPGPAGQIAQAIGAVVGTLPEGEPKPNADFLIIVGMDRK